MTTKKTDEGSHVGRGAGADDERHAFDRQFKYALVVYAVVEFVAVALFVYYKLSR